MTRCMVLSLSALLAACGPRPAAVEPTTTAPADEPEAPHGADTMTLWSTAFEPGAPIPDKHAYEGENEPPELMWANLPEGTVEMALIVEDPDAPGPEPWVHDVFYKIPPDSMGMLTVIRGAAVFSEARLFEGVNSFGEAGWSGPKPPSGEVHRYVFTMFALDEPLPLLAGATKQELLEAMEGHILETAELVGTYQH